MFVAEVGRGQRMDAAPSDVAADFRRHADAIDGRIDDLAGDWAVSAEVAVSTLRSMAGAVGGDNEQEPAGEEVPTLSLTPGSDREPPPQSGLLYLNLACHREQVPPFD